VPALVAVGNGAWNVPRASLSNLLAAQLPADPIEGDYRTLFIGDPRVLPVPSREYRDGVAYALVDDDRLNFTNRWAAPVTGVDDRVREVLDSLSAGSTLRAGRQLASLGVRFVVVPEIDGVGSTTARPRPVPAGLDDRLNAQLDLARAFGAPNVSVYVNRSWVPASALIAGSAGDVMLEPTDTPGDPGSIRLAGAPTAFAGFGPDLVVTDEVDPGVVHLATALDERWWVRIGDERIGAQPGLGLTTAFDLREVPSGTTASLGYDRPTSRWLWVALQVLAWGALLVAASSLRPRLPRRLRAGTGDETLIELGEVPAAGGWMADAELDPDLDPWGSATVQPAPGDGSWAAPAPGSSDTASIDPSGPSSGPAADSWSPPSAVDDDSTGGDR